MDNKFAILMYKQIYRLANKRKISIYDKKRYILTRKYQIQKTKKYNNKHKIRIRNRYLSKEYKYKRNLYLKQRRKKDNVFKIISNLRNRIYIALKLKTKFYSTLEVIGCSPAFLKKYLESKFKPGMSWDNYGKFGWHIDHKIPCCSFNLKKIKEQKKCFHYSNLQPLWAKENLRKEKSRVISRIKY